MSGCRNYTICTVFALIVYIFFLNTYVRANDVVITNPVAGNHNATANTNYLLETTVSGNFTFTSGTGSLHMSPNASLGGSLQLQGGTVSIITDAGSRIGGSILDTSNSANNFTILGTVDSGVQFLGQGTKTITISGMFSQIGYIAGSTASIKGTAQSASIYTISNGAVINGSIELGNHNDTVTIQNASTGAIKGAGGNKTITITNGSVVNGDLDSSNGNDTIAVEYSTITGNLSTGTTGNDSIRLLGSLIKSSIILGHGRDSLFLHESSSVSGNVTSNDTLLLESTFGSSIQGNLSVSNALTLNAPTGILINGTTASGANSTYDVTRGSFLGDVLFNGATTMIALESSFAKNITVQQAGAIHITLIATQGNDIIATINTNTTTIALQRGTTLTNIRLGSGNNTVQSTASQITAISGNNASIDATDSTIHTINIESRLEASFTRSILASPLITTAGNHLTTLTADSSTFKGNISLLGQTTADIRNTLIEGSFTTGNNGDDITIIGSTLTTMNTGRGVDSITLRNTNIKSITVGDEENTINITSSTFTLLQLGADSNTIILNNSNLYQLLPSNTPRADNTLRIEGYNTITGPYLSIARGTMLFTGSLYVNRSTKDMPNAPVLIQGDILEFSNGSSIILSPQPYSSVTYLKFNEIVNKSTQPISILHVNTFNGVTSILNLSQVQQHKELPFLVDFKGVLGAGTPLERIEEVIISSPAIVPRTRHEYILLNGNLYSLKENLTKPNSYDLVYQGISPTNYGYAAAHNAIRSFNTNIWHNILAHYQEEAQMFRNRDGIQRQAGSIVNAISLWARGGYSMSAIKPSFDTPQLNERSVTVLAGLDFANIAIGENISLFFQFFAGAGHLTSHFKKIALGNITLSSQHLAITAGGSIGVQTLTHKGRGKLYGIISTWYSIIDNELDSNLFPATNTWNNQSVSISASLGYSVYIQRILINPQLDLGYFHTFKQTYTSPDLNQITFLEERRMLGRASMLLGYAFPVGITPYLRGGIALPLFRGKGSGNVVIANAPTPYSYDTTSFTSDISLGIAYRGGIEHFSVSFSTEVTLFLGAKKGFEALAQLGFQF